MNVPTSLHERGQQPLFCGAVPKGGLYHERNDKLQCAIRKSYIDDVLSTVEEHLSGELDRETFTDFFPYEVTEKYEKMCEEDVDKAELIEYHLVELGVDVGDDLSDDDFKALIENQKEAVRVGLSTVPPDAFSFLPAIDIATAAESANLPQTDQ